MPSLRTAAVVATTLVLQRAAQAQLNTYAQQAGLQYFGSGTTPAELSDSDYSAVLASTEFGSISGNLGFDWTSVEGSENSFDYADGDSLVQFATSNNQILNCGPVFQYDQLPTWRM
jgi:endo-1,4-beta-xylanase